MRKLFLIFQVILITSLRLASQEEVKVDCQDQWGPGRYNKVSVSIHFSHNGFARFTQEFPEGFTLITDQSGSGDISWGGNQLNAVFMNVSQGKIVNFSYFIKPDAGMNGNFSIQGKLVIISESAKRFTTILKEKLVDISGTNGLLPAEMTKDQRPAEDPPSVTPDQPSLPVTNGKVIFRVQICASSRPIPEQELRKEFRLDKEIKITVLKSGRSYKYQAGEYVDYEAASQLLKKLRDNGLKDAFVVAWSSGKQK